MIEYIDPEAEHAAQMQREMEQRYRNVFGSAEGVLVLGDILQLCHFGWGLNSEEHRIEYNVGIAIARKSGIMSAIDTMLGIKGE